MTVKQYDALEQAIARGQRIAIFRRGTEYLVIPERLVLRGRRECIEARHPTTGASMVLWIDEVDGVEVVR
jgi:hypothetical protein